MTGPKGVDASSGGDPVVQLGKLNAVGELELPLPGGGETWSRWSSLLGWGRRDLVLARLAEGHTDARAILVEADRGPVGDALYGVWAARSRLGLRMSGGVLSGTLRFCSGASGLDRALVVAATDDGTQLVDVDLGDPRVRPVDGSWQPIGMRATDSADVEFAELPVAWTDLVGPAGFYTGRVGFWHGGAGVAAVWLGGALGVLDDLHDWFAEHPPDEHHLAHLGTLHVAAAATSALLQQTAATLDERPGVAHQTAIALVRASAEHTARISVDLAPRLFGSTGLCRDGRLSRRLADLGVYIRQHHGERDLAAIGRDCLDEHCPDDGQRVDR